MYLDDHFGAIGQIRRVYLRQRCGRDGHRVEDGEYLVDRTTQFGFNLGLDGLPLRRGHRVLQFGEFRDVGRG